MPHDPSHPAQKTALHIAIQHSLNAMGRPALWASLGLLTSTSTTSAVPAFSSTQSLTEQATGQQVSTGAVIIVDPDVADAKRLLQGLPVSARVLRLTRDEHPLQQITRFMRTRADVQSMHILSHATAGQLRLAGVDIDQRALQKHAQQLQQWFAADAAGHDILLYGCDLAANAAGNDFIATLAELTGAVVSASDDATGTQAAGGDWVLERTTGMAARAPIFAPQAREEFQGLLATFTVSNTADSGSGSLRQAVLDANAAAGADIVDATGVTGVITLTSGQIDISDDVTINGPGAENLTVSGNDDSRIFDIDSAAANVTIDALTLTDGNSGGQNGGAIYSNVSNRLTVQNAVITGNSTGIIINRSNRGDDYAASGGGISQNEGELVISNTTISNNQAGYDGGGVHFYSDNTDDLLQVTGSTISGNIACVTTSPGPYYGNDCIGGGVAIAVNDYGGSFNINNSTISGNQSNFGGGIGLYADAISSQDYGAEIGGQLSITGSTIADNRATGSGGGVFLYGEEDISAVVISDSNIINNQAGAVLPPVRGGGNAGASGGGIHFANDYGLNGLTISNTTITGNSATGNGGGVMLVFESYGSSVLIENSTVTGNTAAPADPTRGYYYSYSGLGGGIALYNESTGSDEPFGDLTIRDTTISGNTASENGGGLAGFTSFGGKRAAESNRKRTGLHRNAEADKVERRAPAGGGGNVLSEILIENSTFSDNQAAVGGGLSLQAPEARGVQLRNATFSSNVASANAGAIALEYAYSYYGGDGIDLNAEFVTIADNSVIAPLQPDANQGDLVGGISISAESSATFTQSIIANNSSAGSNDVSGAINLDFSLLEDPSGATITGANNITDTDPQLTALADNGGSTQTRLPALTSPVLDVGDPSFLPPPSTDQRGLPRVVNAVPDMGAVEIQMPPDLSITPDPLAFGVVKVGVTTAALNVTLANSDGPLNVTAIAAPSGVFAAAGGSCATPPFTLLDGESCTLAYTFTPAATGTASQQINVTSNDDDGPGSFTLTGEGALGALVITPDPLDFGSVEVGNTGGPLSATLQNTGPVETVISSVTAPTLPFGLAGGTCGGLPISIAAGSSCTLDYDFSPTVSGAASDTLMVISDASTSPDEINLLGSAGEPIVGLGSGDLNFGSVSLGVGETDFVTLTNTGTANLEVSGITNPGAPFTLGFAALGNALCTAPPFTLAPSTSCDIEVTFAPNEPGSFVATFDILSNAPTSPDTVTLRGNAALPLEVPTLQSWGMALMTGLMAMMAWLGLRRKPSLPSQSRK